MTTHWCQNTYRRNVIDMHIPDWDPRFLSEFDEKAYVEMLRRAEVQSAVVYANSGKPLRFPLELPNVPVDAITVRVRTGDCPVKRVVKLPEGRPVPFQGVEDAVAFTTGRFETFAMCALQTESTPEHS